MSLAVRPKHCPALALIAALLAQFMACAPHYSQPDLTFDPAFEAVDTDTRESGGWQTSRVLFLDQADTGAREAMVVLLHQLPEGLIGTRSGFTGTRFMELETAELDKLMANPVQYMQEMDAPSDPMNEVRHGLHWALMTMARRGLPLYGDYRAVAKGIRMATDRNKTVVYLFAPQRLDPGQGWHDSALARFDAITGNTLDTEKR